MDSFKIYLQISGPVCVAAQIDQYSTQPPNFSTRPPLKNLKDEEVFTVLEINNNNTLEDAVIAKESAVSMAEINNHVSSTDDPVCVPSHIDHYYSMPPPNFSTRSLLKNINIEDEEVFTVLVPYLGGFIINNNSTLEDAVIAKESAVCRFCFKKLAANDDTEKVVKAQCKCPYFMALAHYKCALEWSRKKGGSKCEKCGQDTKFIRVTIFSGRPKAMMNSMDHAEATNRGRRSLYNFFSSLSAGIREERSSSIFRRNHNR